MNKKQITKEAIEGVANRIGLSLEFIDQDWHVMMAQSMDAKRFMCYYDSFTHPEEKSVLMWFILATYDNYLRNCANNMRTPDPVVANTLIRLLRDNWDEHSDAVEYWGCLDYGDNGTSLEDESECFAITPLMRKLWREHHQDTQR
jgi:hypothetical protein